MTVIAGEPGVLQTLNNLELGQWVQQGQELARVAQPGRLKAVLRVPESQAKDVAVGQTVKVDLHNNQIVRGRVIRADPSAQAGTVTVEVAIDDAIPAGVRADQSVDGTIEIENLRNVLHVNRPVYGQAEQTVGLFKLNCPAGTPQNNCTEAVQVQVKLGRASVSVVEVQSGLNAGDRIIVSDMAQQDGQARVRIKW
jgi:HlyD family secretion protein